MAAARSLVVRLLLVLLWGACGALARAQAPVMVTSSAPTVSLEGHLRALRDPRHHLSPAAAAQSSGWQTLPGLPSFGFTGDAVWLRFEVRQPEVGIVTRRLEFTNALLEDVRLYQSLADGIWFEQRSGSVVTPQARPVDARNAVFDVELPGGTTHFLARIETRASLTTDVFLGPPADHAAAAWRNVMAWGTYAGIYLGVILMQALFWVWTRERRSGAYIAYALLHVTAILLSVGHLQRALDLDGDTALRWLGVSMALTVAAGVRYTSGFLELGRVAPRIARGIWHAALPVALAATALVIADRYALGVPLAQVAMTALMLLYTGLAIVLARRGHAPARHFLWLFGPLHLLALIRFAANLGLLPSSTLTRYAVQVGSLLHIVAMNVYLFHRYHTTQRSLDGEREALKQQRRFVSVLSHDLRAPLANIDHAVRDLANSGSGAGGDLQTRGIEIRSAARRMADTLDNYLTAERIEDVGRRTWLQRTNPLAFVAQAVAEWPSSRVRLDASGLPTECHFDAGLLKLALRNLIGNADRHAPDGSMVTVRARAKRGGWCVAVEDDGPGIDADDLPRLFQKHSSARGAQGSPAAGLGLFIVRDVAEAHGGRVSVDSRPGRTVFEIFLPALPGAPQDPLRPSGEPA